MPSGWLLFLCLLLPSFKFCDRGAALPALILPPLWPPYIAGLLVAFAALAGPLRARESARRLGWFIYVVVIGYDLLFVRALADGATEWAVIAVALIVSLVVLSIAWWGRRSSTELATTVLAWMLALAAAVCGLALAFGPHAVWGGTVTAIVACALVIGTTWWLVEAAVARIRG